MWSYSCVLPQCSLMVRWGNYSTLTPEEKKLFWAFQSREYWRPWIIRHYGSVYVLTKRWRKNNPDKWYSDKLKTVRRHNDETIPFATSNHQPWGSDEIEYIREVGQQMTAREIAIDLGRTYNAVIARACMEHIPLTNDDKRKGRLITTPAVIRFRNE